MPQVVLQQKALQALASEPRVGVLKALRDRQQTLTQVARILGADRAAVYRHLQVLREGGLVERDDAHGFAYYRLTWQGRGVVDPGESTRITILLGTALGLGAAAIAAFALYLTPRWVVEPDPFLGIHWVLLPPEPGFLAAGGGLLAALVALLALVQRRVRPGRAKLVPEERAEERSPLPP